MEAIGMMFMLAMSENATDVRKKWSDFIDIVLLEITQAKPIITTIKKY